MSTVFDEFCVQYSLVQARSGRIPEAAREEVDRCLDQFRVIAEVHASTRKPEHQIHIGIVDDLSFNAWAATWEGHDLIGINIGCLIDLRMLTQCLVLTEPFRWISQEEKSGVSMWMYECAKFFVFFHELAHIWNGHTSLVQERGGICILEAGQARIDKLSALDYKTLEMDADGFATTNVLTLTLSIAPETSINPHWEEKWGKGSTRLILCSSSLYAMFALFAGAQERAQDTEIHPSPAQRQYMVASTLSTLHLEKELPAQVVTEGAILAERAVSEIERRPLDVEAIQRTFYGEGWSYSVALLKNWAKLRPELDLLKRGGILPPVQEILDSELLLRPKGAME